MQLSVETITPDRARQLLVGNTCNRRLMKANVSFFRSQLERGEWQLSHQGIALAPDGRLLDGQHRLTAIAESGISAQILVAYGVDPSTFQVLDTGAKRGSADVLSIKGASHCTNLAAALRLICLYDSCPHLKWSGPCTREHGTPARLLAIYEPNAQQLDRIIRISASQASTSILCPGPFAAAWFLAERVGVSASFMEQMAIDIKHGAGLASGDPVLAFRNRFMYLRGITTQERLASYIRLVNFRAWEVERKTFKIPAIPPMPRIETPSALVGSLRQTMEAE